MLIDISRASNIDEAALLHALETKALGSAALDVFEGEPNLDLRISAMVGADSARSWAAIPRDRGQLEPDRRLL